MRISSGQRLCIFSLCYTNLEYRIPRIPEKNARSLKAFVMNSEPYPELRQARLLVSSRLVALSRSTKLEDSSALKLVATLAVSQASSGFVSYCC